MKAWREVVAEIFRRKLDSLVNILALVLAVTFIPNLWLKVLLLPVIAFSLFKVWESAQALQREKHIPLIVVVYGDEAGRDSFIDDCLRQMNSLGFDEAAFSGLGVDRDDWLISRPGDLPADERQWKGIVLEFRRKLDHIKAKLKGPEFFHVFTKCRTALVFALGATAGTWSNVVIHQEESGGHFKPVIFLDSKTDLPNHHATHTIKSTVEPPYRFIKTSIPKKLTSPTLVALNLAGHPPRSYVRMEAKKRRVSCVMIDNMYGNTLTEEDWFRPAQEIASVLLCLAQPANELEIYASCPNALAFAIGMALGDQYPATIFHFFAEDNTYKPVLKLNKLY